MRIGSAVILTGDAHRKQKQAEKAEHTSVKHQERFDRDLREYENYQKKAFEGEWMGRKLRGAVSAGGLQQRLDEIATDMAKERSPFTVRAARLRAESWAIQQVLKTP